MSRRRVLLVLSCLGALGAALAIYGFTREEAPGRGDIDTSAFVAYPGSTLTKDFFQKADSGRYIDTGGFSNPTRLIRRYELSQPVPRAEFERWRDATYPPPGWQLTGRPDSNQTLYGRTVGKRQHVLDVSIVAGGPDKPLVPQYEVTYSVV